MIEELDCGNGWVRRDYVEATGLIVVRYSMDWLQFAVLIDRAGIRVNGWSPQMGPGELAVFQTVLAWAEWQHHSLVQAGAALDQETVARQWPVPETNCVEA